MEDNSYKLIIAYFEKTISDEGLNQLQEWIEASPEHLSQFSETIQILEASKSYFKQQVYPEKAWSKIHAHISREDLPQLAKRQGRKWISYAAACLICCILGTALYQYRPGSSEIYQTVSNRNGQQARFTLPDSSVVYLGGGSTLKYPKNFNGKIRNVDLDGEAFFDVVHQSAHPFTVNTGDITTVVLGTSFNIKAYDTEHKVAVTVKTGKVAVMAKHNGQDQVIKYLLPDDQISINTQNGLYTFSEISANDVVSWINHDFIFYNTSLEDIATALEHHYGIAIEFTDPDLSKVRLTAKFKNITLTEAMENISILSGLAFTQNGNHLYISNNNQKGGKIMK
ncbi:FecR family protein [Pedobacter westerhofensis]|uniref:FecR family protein n=1 Tax=Pedobacter westerhofensis TaxID=425512 RepID=A0A521B6G8_9SPHI|nr:FecR domain-containing protein [Pedobacter westerhofensis]SMO42655.1 FecR family protein [Pedobacter westerhofensis]